MKRPTWRQRAAVWGGTFAVAALCSLAPTDSPPWGVRPAHSQSTEATDAIEYGIALGLPRAWAYRVAWCESRWQPWAYNRASGASGLFQFLPSTFAATPQGRAGLDVFDPYVNAEAAAWLFAHYGPGQWACR